MKLKLQELKLKSFVTDPQKMRAGAVIIMTPPESNRACSPLCMYSEWAGCN